MLLGLVHGEVVFVDVALEDVRFLPFFLAEQEGASGVAAGDGLVPCEVGDVFTGEAFAVDEVFRIDPFVRVVVGFGVEHPLDVRLGPEGDTFDEFGPDAFFFQAFVQPALGYVGTCSGHRPLK